MEQLRLQPEEMEMNAPVAEVSTKYRTEDECFRLAAEAYEKLEAEDPGVRHAPGYAADRICEMTGVDFSTASIVAMSATD